MIQTKNNQAKKSPENSISIQAICQERPSTAVKMNLNSEQTLTEYAVARNEYKAATIEARAFVECSINRAPAGSWRA